MKEKVILILCDQLRADALSCYGDENINTPNIDLLASEGVKFTNAIATNPLCCPARGNIISGLYNTNHTVKFHEDKMIFDRKTMIDVFNENNYETIYIGKWHLDGFREREGLAREHIVKYEERGNFKTWIGYENNNSPFDNIFHGHIKDVEIEPIKTNEYEVDYLTDFSLKMLDERENENFFLWLNYQPPHNPYVAPAQYMNQFHRKDIKLKPNVPSSDYYKKKALDTLPGYYAMIKNIDDNLGKITKYLKDNNLYKDTHIIFYSDHGDQHQSHGCTFKTNYFQESINVPLIIGGTIPFSYKYNNYVSNQTIGQSDIAPTICGLAGLNPGEIFDGIDFSAIRTKRKYFFEKDYTMFELIKGADSTSSKVPFRGIYTNDNYKYVVTECGPIALYDLNNDKFEQANLILNPHYNEIANKMDELLRVELKKQKDEFKY